MKREEIQEEKKTNHNTQGSSADQPESTFERIGGCCNVYSKIEKRLKDSMKGLDLAQAYFHEFGFPMLSRRFPGVVSRIAAGLAGPGSECFGYDDELSRDHDWGPGFCLWLEDDDFKRYGTVLAEEYAKLPGEFLGFGPRRTSPGEEGRIGPMKASEFFFLYTGLGHPPDTISEWLSVPEINWGLVTNGRVFYDPAGSFTARRKAIAAYYPEDIRLKKIASRCLTIGQAGQYNMQRSFQREEPFAFHYAAAEFSRDVMWMVYLLNRRFVPFYKWLHRGVRDLPVLGREVYDGITKVIRRGADIGALDAATELIGLVTAEMRRQGLSGSTSPFILDHAAEVHEKIEDAKLSASLTVFQ
ncbi:MAG: DUF4037 domain-containing protein [bacterium]